MLSPLGDPADASDDAHCIRLLPYADQISHTQMMHDQLVRNDLLAQLSDLYGITDMLRTSHEQRYATKMQTKVRGSIFESYIAGVFYAHLEGGDNAEQAAISPPSSSKPSNDRDIPGQPKGEAKLNASSPEGQARQTLCSSNPREPSRATASVKEAIEAEEGDTNLPQGKQKRTYGDALDHTYLWLRPLFRPILDHALKAKQDYQRLLEAVEQEADPTEEVKKVKQQELVAGGAAGALNTYCEHTYGNQPIYTCEREGLHEWKITCTVTTDEGKVL